MTTTRNKPRAAAAGAIALAAAVVIAGCGSDSKSNNQTTQRPGFGQGPSGATGQGGPPGGMHGGGPSGAAGGPPGGGQGGPPGSGAGPGIQVTGTAGKKAKAAALAKVSGTVEGLVKDQRGGGGYVAIVKKKDGSTEIVLIDKNYKVTGTQQMPQAPNMQQGSNTN